MSGLFHGRRVSTLSSACFYGVEEYAARWSEMLHLPRFPLRPVTGGWVAGPGVVRLPGERGSTVAYHQGARLGVEFVLKNLSDKPLKLLRVYSGNSDAVLLRPIGVRISRYVAPKRTRDSAELGPLPPLHPFLVQAREEIAVRENFQVGNCRLFRPGERRTYNRRVFVDVTAADTTEQGVTITLPGDQLTIVSPAHGQCRR